jgi:gliding motility-associated-like protein
VTDLFGCTAADGVTVLIDKRRPVFVPNVFSPNNDGLNDLFSVFAGPSVTVVKSFLVFNRWGETVYEYYDFEPNNPALGWDGRHRDKTLDPAVFTWFAEIEFIDGEVELFEGDVVLMR